MFASMLQDSCIEFFRKQDIQSCIKETVRPVGNIIYNEIYPYIWFICIYNVFLIFITLANFVVILWIRNLLRSVLVIVRSHDVHHD